MTTPSTITASLMLNGRHVEFSVRKSLKARRARIRVTALGVEVVLPRRVPLHEAHGMLRKHASWVEKQLDKRARADAVRQEHRRLHPNTIMLRGTPTKVAFFERAGDSSRGDLDAAAADVQVPIPKAATAHFQRALETWLRRIAREEIESRLAIRAREMNCSYNRVTIRGQRARWGSCSSRGNLSFNWRLIQAPPEVLDYVVVHELAHRIEFNHSRRFWSIVAAHCPEFARWKRWLREHQPLLDLHAL